jgi:hypothetical protein
MTESNGFMHLGINTMNEPSENVTVLVEDDQECAQFQALMAKRIEAGEDLQSNPHLLTCERCTALVNELEFIADFARQLIPREEEPREELWDKIQLAIESGEA